MTDPEGKLRNANEHLKALAALVDTFALKAYSVDAQPDFWSETWPPAKGDVIIWAEAVADPPSVLWGPIIGDIVHGFRSALDQLIWGLSVDHQFPGNIPPSGRIPWGNPWRDVWFPVCNSCDAWKNAAKTQLRYVDPTLAAKLKPLQPFVTGQNAPEREPLAVLQELWNIDKHRHLHLVNATVELHDVLSVDPFPDIPNTTGVDLMLNFEIVSRRAPGPLVGRAEVGRARHIRKPGGLLAVSHPQMHMDPRLLVDVAFDQGYPAYGGRVLHTLRQIGETVSAILAAV